MRHCVMKLSLKDSRGSDSVRQIQAEACMSASALAGTVGDGQGQSQAETRSCRSLSLTVKILLFRDTGKHSRALNKWT